MKIRGNEIEYFWELEKYFVEFLQNLFPNNYKRKFSLEGNGIFNLLIMDNGDIYEIKFSQGKKMIDNTQKETTDKQKNEIMNIIMNNLKNKYARDGGKISFKLDKYIIKLEFVKKRAMPK